MNYRQRAFVCAAIAAAVTSPLLVTAAHATTPTPSTTAIVQEIAAKDTKASGTEVLGAGTNADGVAKELMAQAGGRPITQLAIGPSALGVTDEGKLLAVDAKNMNPASKYLDRAQGKTITRITGSYHALEALSQDGQSVLQGTDLAGHKAVDVAGGKDNLANSRQYYITDDGALLRSNLKGAATEVAQDIALVAATADLNGDSRYVAVNRQGEVVGDGSQAKELAQAAHGHHITQLVSNGWKDVYALTADSTVIAVSEAWGDAGPKYAEEITKQAAGRKIVQIATGGPVGEADSLVALTEDGTVLAAGDDSASQVSGLLEKTKGRHVTSVAAGNGVTLAVADKIDDPDHQDSKLDERSVGFWLHNAPGETGDTVVTVTDKGNPGNTATVKVNGGYATVTMPKGVKEMTLEVKVNEEFYPHGLLGSATLHLTRDAEGRATVLQVTAPDRVTIEHENGNTGENYIVTAKPRF
ncbi:hypothetical protein [Streptomyces sp. NPDC050848]|uniref:hypothetical protein n=1 Tax=Streptomyces sp. NPDC050848 TaxID=3155791 RepID=UPI0033DF0166